MCHACLELTRSPANSPYLLAEAMARTAMQGRWRQTSGLQNAIRIVKPHNLTGLSCMCVLWFCLCLLCHHSNVKTLLIILSFQTANPRNRETQGTGKRGNRETRETGKPKARKPGKAVFRSMLKLKKRRG